MLDVGVQYNDGTLWGKPPPPPSDDDDGTHVGDALALDLDIGRVCR